MYVPQRLEESFHDTFWEKKRSNTGAARANRSTPTLILSLPIKSRRGKKQGLAELKLRHLQLFLTRDDFLLPLLTCFPAI